jgi:thioester reductase-like protein
MELFSALNTTVDDFEERVTFVHADLASPKLGLDEEIYQSLRDRVGLTIHNAWPVNLTFPFWRSDRNWLVW